MEKFLYLTDQNENAENSFIGPLFEKYLGTSILKLHVLYFSKTSENFEIKRWQSDLSCHLQYKNEIIAELE